MALSAFLAPLLAAPHVARADSLDQFGLHRARGEAKFASGAGNLLFLAGGTLLPLVESGGRAGRQQTFRTADSVLTATLVTEALKAITKEKRPDGSSRTSFPSGHATAAFAVATMAAHFHHRQAPFWFAGATIIGASRVQLKRHYWHDVIAGAAVGYFSTEFELKSHRGLLLRRSSAAAPRKKGVKKPSVSGCRECFEKSSTCGSLPLIRPGEGSRVRDFYALPLLRKKPLQTSSFHAHDFKALRLLAFRHARCGAFARFRRRRLRARRGANSRVCDGANFTGGRHFERATQ